MKWCGHYTRVSSLVLGVALTCLMGMVLVGCPPPPVTPPAEEVIPPPQSFAPGLAVVIEEVAIPADLRPEVIFSLEDEDGNAIALSEVSVRFIMAYLETPATGSTARWLSYTLNSAGDQATSDGARNGGVTQNNDGTLTYKFDTVLPADYDAAAPHQISGQFARTYPIDGLDYVANPVYRFVPSGAAAKQITGRDIVLTETCNSCHTRLEFHGGDRREIQYCIMCHNTQSVDPDTGNSVDMAQLIHKIHRGANLPSVQEGEPYEIIGHGGSVHDYSEVVFPQDIRNCAVCHTGADASDVWNTAPTLEGCVSCHDRTWFGSGSAPEGYEAHIGGAQENNALCSACHKSDAIMDYHVKPVNSSAAPGLLLDIVDVQTAAVEGGFSLTISVQVTDGSGVAINDLTELSSMNPVVAWPTTDYQQYVRESIGGTPTGTLTPNGNGMYTYTFAEVFPMTSDTFAVSLEGRRSFAYGDGSVTQGTDSTGLTFFTADGSAPVMRRAIVDEAKCNVCHEEIRAHGEQRFTVSHCLLCHNVNETDAEVRLEGTPESVNFKNMIHSIHAGAELNVDLVIYGYRNSIHDYSGVHFPGKLNSCTMCHLEGTVDLPLEGVEPTTISDEEGTVLSVEQPERAACTTCHDGLLNEVHAMLQTDANGVESCAVCHGPGADFAVDEVHMSEP